MTKATETPEKASLLHHMATVAAGQEVVTIKTVDGKSATGKLDAVFADGLSLMVADHKLYFPLAGTCGLRFILRRTPRDRRGRNGGRSRLSWHTEGPPHE